MKCDCDNARMLRDGRDIDNIDIEASHEPIRDHDVPFLTNQRKVNVRVLPTTHVVWLFYPTIKTHRHIISQYQGNLKLQAATDLNKTGVLFVSVASHGDPSPPFYYYKSDDPVSSI